MAIKKNNNIENLEWCSAKQNAIHYRSITNNGNFNAKGLPFYAYAYNIYTKQTIEASSIKTISKILNISKTQTHRLIKNKRISKSGWKLFAKSV